MRFNFNFRWGFVIGKLGIVWLDLDEGARPVGFVGRQPRMES